MGVVVTRHYFILFYKLEVKGDTPIFKDGSKIDLHERTMVVSIR